MLDIFVRAISHLLVPLFAIGMVGSTVVVAITFSHDLVDFFEDDDDVSPSVTPGNQHS